MKIKVLPVIALGMFLSVSAANASLITADATGADSFSTTDYWGVSFDSGNGYISSITFDLTPFGGDVFDFDGSVSYNNATEPVLGAMSGLTDADITASFVGNHPDVLTFNFDPFSFGVGDYFRFSADVDQILTGDQAAGLLFSVTMDDGTTANGALAVTSVTNQAAVTLDVQNRDPIPEPATMLLFGTGLMGLAASSRRRK